MRNMVPMKWRINVFVPLFKDRDFFWVDCDPTTTLFTHNNPRILSPTKLLQWTHHTTWPFHLELSVLSFTAEGVRALIDELSFLVKRREMNKTKKNHSNWTRLIYIYTDNSASIKDGEKFIGSFLQFVWL